MPGVVRRVDIDHLDLAEIALLQELEDFQIIALDVEVFGGIPVTAVLLHRAQGLGDGPCRLCHGRFFAHPCEFIALVAVHHLPAQKLLQHLKIDAAPDLTVLAPHLGNGRGKQHRDLINIPRYHVRGFKFKLVHLLTLLAIFFSGDLLLWQS